MRYTRGLNKETGADEGRQDARAKPDNPTKAERYSHTFNCLNPKCEATYHWRKAVDGKENTGQHQAPKTFVHNYKHPHTEPNCRYDYKNFARQHRQVEIDKNDILNLRISFPIGGALADLRPDLPGMLSHAQKQVANDNISKQGFNSLRKLVDFIDSKMGGLSDPILSDVVLSYQGLKNNWDDLWTPASEYSNFLVRSQELDIQKRTAPVLALVKPERKGGLTRTGKTKFICQTEYTQFESKEVAVKPILVLFDNNMTSHFEQVARKSEPVLVASRPMQVVNRRNGVRNIYLSVVSTNQLARVDKENWRSIPHPSKQTSITLST
jgi:hypothetical protein